MGCRYNRQLGANSQLRQFARSTLYAEGHWPMDGGQLQAHDEDVDEANRFGSCLPCRCTLRSGVRGVRLATVPTGSRSSAIEAHQAQGVPMMKPARDGPMTSWRVHLYHRALGLPNRPGHHAPLAQGPSVRERAVSRRLVAAR
jgi:hypothetical protein